MEMVSKKQWTSQKIARGTESPVNSGGRLGHKRMLQRDIKEKKNKRKGNEAFDPVETVLEMSIKKNEE